MTMTVDKDIMKFEKKGLGNSETFMDLLALGGVQTLCIVESAPRWEGVQLKEQPG
jgi:hypothetical protein